MLKRDIKCGRVYTAKISNRVVPVRINTESRHGGWNGTNLLTQRDVYIRTAARLRDEVTCSCPSGKYDEQCKFHGKHGFMPASKVTTRARGGEPKSTMTTEEAIIRELELTIKPTFARLSNDAGWLHDNGYHQWSTIVSNLRSRIETAYIQAVDEVMGT